MADIDNDNPLVAEEQFGPALPIIRYSTVDEAVAMANALDVGLGASVWSSNLAEARKVAARIEAGTVWINKHGAVDPRVPFGGAKQSGYGLEFGVEGLESPRRPAGHQRLNPAVVCAAPPSARAGNGKGVTGMPLQSFSHIYAW